MSPRNKELSQEMRTQSRATLMAAARKLFAEVGYFNSRIAKMDKHGSWIKSWGQAGGGGVHANENPGNLNTPHNIAIDRQDNVYVGDRGNRRIQVFDRDGNFKRFIFLNTPYDKKRHPVLGNLPRNSPDETAPWALCVTKGAKQYMYAADTEPGRIYKIALPEGTIVGMFGESGRQLGQFNWAHSIACPADDLLFVADMNNWRVQKLILHPNKEKEAELLKGRMDLGAVKSAPQGVREE